MIDVLRVGEGQCDGVRSRLGGREAWRSVPIETMSAKTSRVPFATSLRNVLGQDARQDERGGDARDDAERQEAHDARASDLRGQPEAPGNDDGRERERAGCCECLFHARRTVQRACRSSSVWWGIGSGRTVGDDGVQCANAARARAHTRGGTPLANVFGVADSRLPAEVSGRGRGLSFEGRPREDRVARTEPRGPTRSRSRTRRGSTLPPHGAASSNACRAVGEARCARCVSLRVTWARCSPGGPQPVWRRPAAMPCTVTCATCSQRAASSPPSRARRRASTWR